MLAYFPQRQLNTDENKIPEKAFWRMFLATRDTKEVEELWLTYFILTTIMKKYFLEDNEEIRKVFRETMEGQFEYDLYNKSFSNQLKTDETKTLQQKIKWWMSVASREATIPNNVYDYSFAELFKSYRKAIDPEMEQLAQALRDRQIIPLKQEVKPSINNNLT